MNPFLFLKYVAIILIVYASFITVNKGMHVYELETEAKRNEEGSAIDLNNGSETENPITKDGTSNSIHKQLDIPRTFDNDITTQKNNFLKYHQDGNPPSVILVPNMVNDNVRMLVEEDQPNGTKRLSVYNITEQDVQETTRNSIQSAKTSGTARESSFIFKFNSRLSASGIATGVPSASQDKHHQLVDMEFPYVTFSLICTSLIFFICVNIAMTEEGTCTTAYWLFLGLSYPIIMVFIYFSVEYIAGIQGECQCRILFGDVNLSHGRISRPFVGFIIGIFTFLYALQYTSYILLYIIFNNRNCLCITGYRWWGVIGTLLPIHAHTPTSVLCNHFPGRFHQCY